MLAIKCGEVDGEELVKFDGRLKSEIVLYLALEKEIQENTQYQIAKAPENRELFITS